MATQYVPGAYPGSIPPTPADESVQQPIQQEQQVSEHPDHYREHNKLQKVNGPRGHVHADSGVGLIDNEPRRTEPIKHNKEHREGPSEAVGGGTYIRDNFESPTSNNSSRKFEQPSPDLEEFPTRRNQNAEEAFAAATATERGKRVGDEKTKTSQDLARQSGHFGGASDLPPYWGSLPKTTGGGIYNTVTGHGSAHDDHDQHHHLPQRGGIYNSVAGHGSRDEEAMRHSLSRMPDDTGANTGASLGAGGGLATAPAPLPKIGEGEQQHNFSPTGTHTSQPNIAPGFLPEAAVRDDAALLAAPQAGPAEHAHASNDGPNPQQTTGTTPSRVFPLASAHHAAEPDKTKGHKQKNSRLENALPLTSAALIADGAAHGLPDKNEHANQQVQPFPVHQETRHGRSASEDQGHHGVGGILPHRSREEKRASSVDKHRRRLEQTPSPKGEKKHKILGIFHRHKDDTPKEDTSTYEPARQSGEHHREPQRKEESVNGIAVGTKNSRNVLRKASVARETSPEPSPRVGQSDHHKEKVAAGAAGGAGAFGLLHHKKDSDDLRAEKQYHEGGHTSSAPAQATSSQAQPQQDQAYSSHPNQPLASQTQPPHEPSKTASGSTSYPNAFTGAGAAVGPGAYGFARKHEQAPDPAKTAPVGLPVHHQTEEVTTPFEHPRQPPLPPNTDFTHAASSTNHGHGAHVVYNTLPSGTSSGVQRDSQSHTTSGSHARGAATNEPGNYNTLASGTPSVVYTGRSSDVVAKEPGTDNVLMSSGAPSSSKATKSECKTATRDPHTQHPLDPNSTAFGVAYGTGNTDASKSKTSSSQYDTDTPHARTHHPLDPNVMPSAIAHEAKNRDVSRSRSPTNKGSNSHNLPGGAVAQAPGEYNQLSSGTASGIRQDQVRPSESNPAKKGVITQGGDYNRIASGATSGVKRDSGSSGTGTTTKAVSDSARPSQSRTDSGPYNKLPSGTPSGVKIKPKEHRPRQSTEPSVPAHNEPDASGRERYNSLPSANVASGFGRSSQAQARGNVSDRTTESKDLPLPASSSSPTQANPSAYHTVISPPVHAAPETGKQTNPPPHAEKLATPQFTPFPNPELMQNMSPEVMPDSYRESVSSSHPRSPPEHKVSPEVIPAAYSASHARAARSKPTPSSHNKFDDSAARDLNSNAEGLRTMPSSSRPSINNSDGTTMDHRDPALAAAAASWASTTGKFSGNGLRNGGRGKVMHTCEHCGKDNDISGYFQS